MYDYFLKKDSYGRIRFYIKKSIYNDFMQWKKSLDKLDYFKRLAKRALKDAFTRESDSSQPLKKSLLIMEKAGYPIGTIRVWKGKKFIKIAPNKWRPKYDEHSRGAKNAITRLMHKVDACNDSGELLQLVLANKARFSDSNGRPYPWVQELSEYCSKANDKIESAKKTNNSTKKQTGGGGGEPPTGRVAKMRQALKEKLKSQFGLHTNKEQGTQANLSRTSIGKITSDKAIEKSKNNGFTVDEHFEVAENIVKLFENANLVKKHKDIKNNKIDLEIERFLSREIALSTGKKAKAYITVKHTLSTDGRSIYSLETMTLAQIKMPPLKEANGRLQSPPDNSIIDKNKDLSSKIPEFKKFKENCLAEYRQISTTGGGGIPNGDIISSMFADDEIKDENIGKVGQELLKRTGILSNATEEDGINFNWLLEEYDDKDNNFTGNNRLGILVNTFNDAVIYGHNNDGEKWGKYYMSSQDKRDRAYATHSLKLLYETIKKITQPKELTQSQKDFFIEKKSAIDGAIQEIAKIDKNGSFNGMEEHFRFMFNKGYNELSKIFGDLTTDELKSNQERKLQIKGYVLADLAQNKATKQDILDFFKRAGGLEAIKDELAKRQKSSKISKSFIPQYENTRTYYW